MNALTKTLLEESRSKRKIVVVTKEAVSIPSGA